MASWWRNILVPWGWEERELPLLATRHENPVHEAFANWRAARGKRGFLGIRRPEINLDPWVIAWSAGILVLFIALFAFCGCLALLALVPLSVFVERKLSKTRIASRRLPARVGEVFSRHGFREAPAIDLWLAGAKGREVAAAIYVDSVRGALWIYRVLFLIPLLFTLIILHNARGLVSIDTLLILPAVWLLSVQFYRLFLIGHADGVLNERVRRRINNWMGGSQALEEFAKGILFIVIGVFALIVYGGISIGLSILIEAVLKGSQLPAADHLRPVLIALVWILVPVGGLVPMNRALLGYHVRRIDEILIRANIAFDFFMSRTVVGDIDTVLAMPYAAYGVVNPVRPPGTLSPPPPGQGG